MTIEDRLAKLRNEVWGVSVINRPEVREADRRENARWRELLGRTHLVPGPIFTAGMEVSSESAASTIATDLVRQREILVIEAIDHAIGHDDWSLIDVIGRGMFIYQPDGHAIFSFDGRHLLTFYPIETCSEGDTRSQVTVKGVQKYRRHYECHLSPDEG